MREEKRRKKWERVFLSWNASNFSHAPNSLLPLRQARRIKSPKKRHFFSSKLDFLFLRWKISALPLLDPLPVKSLRNEKAFTKTAVSLLIEMSVKKASKLRWLNPIIKSPVWSSPRPLKIDNCNKSGRSLLLPIKTGTIICDYRILWPMTVDDHQKPSCTMVGGSQNH